MVKDVTKIHDGTMDKSVSKAIDFDSLSVGKIYGDFDVIVKGVNNLLAMMEIRGFAVSIKSESTRLASIIIVLASEEDIERLKPVVIKEVEGSRDVVVAHDVTLKLRFLTPAMYYVLDEEEIKSV